MLRQMLKAKIHRATVTDANVEYEGSITIDADLLEAADILVHENVLVANLTNGSRIESYAIAAPRGSGIICLNGGAAKHGKRGDCVIVMNFCVLDEEEVKTHMPRIVRVNTQNRMIEPSPRVAETGR